MYDTKIFQKKNGSKCYKEINQINLQAQTKLSPELKKQLFDILKIKSIANIQSINEEYINDVIKNNSGLDVAVFL